MEELLPEVDLTLPKFVFTRLLDTDEVILIKRGVSGYYPQDTHLAPEQLNDKSVTEAQIKAMEYGSAFGWDKSVAFAATWEKDLAKKKSK